jgi:hypothetical protein
MARWLEFSQITIPARSTTFHFRLQTGDHDAKDSIYTETTKFLNCLPNLDRHPVRAWILTRSMAHWGRHPPALPNENHWAIHQLLARTSPQLDHSQKTAETRYSGGRFVMKRSPYFWYRAHIITVGEDDSEGQRFRLPEAPLVAHWNCVRSKSVSIL